MGTKKWSEIKKLSKATETDRAEARADLEAELRTGGGRTIQELLDQQDELAAKFEAFDPHDGIERPVSEYLELRRQSSEDFLADKEWVEIVASARKLFDLVGRHRENFTSTSESAQRQYGAAGLARGCGLLAAAIASHEAGEDEAVGVLTRAILETWTSGAFVLFGGAESLARLEAELQRNEQALITNNAINGAELLAERKAELHGVAKAQGFQLGEDGEPRFDKLTVEVMAKELGPLIEKATGEAADALLVYNMLYRSYSTFDTHGLSPLQRQLNLDDLPRISMRQPKPWIEAHSSVAVACLLLAVLGEWVYASFGIDEPELAEVLERLMPIALQACAVAVSGATTDVFAALPAELRTKLTM